WRNFWIDTAWRCGPGITAPCRCTSDLGSRPAAGPASISTTRLTTSTSWSRRWRRRSEGSTGRRRRNSQRYSDLRIRPSPHVRFGDATRRDQLRALRRTLQADEAAIAQVVRLFEYAVVVHFAGPRLVAAGMIGQLQIADLLEAVAQPAAQIAFA